MTPVISLKGVGKRYRISSSRSAWMKDLLRPGKRSSTHEFWALEGIDLEVERGSTLGILGRNGAGKSTLLQIISGVTQPTVGDVRVDGRLTAIFGLGSGFNPEIADFAEIGEFMDQPIKTYSSGMKARLGFAVAACVEPEILILDEALSTGDAAFKKRALQRMYDLRDSGTTVLFVSHSLGMVRKFCTEAVLIHKGHLISSGDPESVVTEYRDLLESSNSKKAAQSERDRDLDYALDHEDEEDMPTFAAGKGRNASARPAGRVEIELLDGRREPATSVPSGGELTVRARVRFAEAVRDGEVSVAVRDHSGTLLYATSTDLEGTALGARAKDESVTVDFTFGVPLPPGRYGADVSASGDGLAPEYGEATFEVVAGDEVGDRGPIPFPTTVEVHEGALRE
jgi:ABC-type polysaccharide/polyol phosphate transport system ATPase subunit